MQAFKKVGVILSLAALSVSASWATGGNSFVAKVKLSNENVVPSVLGTAEDFSDLCLTFFKPTSAEPIGQSSAQVAQQVRVSPWVYRLGGRGNITDFFVRNVRLYFGQSFANGQPILTLCDNDLDKNLDDDEDQCPENTNTLAVIQGPDFDLNSVQFQPEQIDSQTVFTIADDTTGRLYDIPCDSFDPEERQCGFLVIKELIKRGLIYVVYNSDIKASRLEDGTIEYEFPESPSVVDGDIRGTLRLRRSPCPPPDPEE